MKARSSEWHTKTKIENVMKSIILLRRPLVWPVGSLPHVAASLIASLLSTVGGFGGSTFPMRPAFLPDIPSSANGDVTYEYYFSGCSGGQLDGCNDLNGMSVTVVTWEYGTVSGLENPVRDRGSIQAFTDYQYRTCTPTQYEVWTLRAASKNLNGITVPPTYLPNGYPGWKFDSELGYSVFDDDSTNYYDNFIANFAPACPLSTTTQTFTDTNGHWSVTFVHGTNAFFAEEVYQWECNEENWESQCFRILLCPGYYYKITVQIDQGYGYSFPSLSSLGIPSLAGFSMAASNPTTNSPPATNATGIIAGPIVNPANDHRYILLEPMSWASAAARAVSLGGHLVTINDAAENNWVSNTFSSFGGVNRTLWIGLQDYPSENTFGWISGDSSSYRKWSSGEPNNGGGYYPNEDSVSLLPPGSSYPGHWNDVSGPDWQYAAVVEIDPSSPSILAVATNSANSHVYYMLAETSWNLGELIATVLGGHLVTINNTDENDWVLSAFGSVGGVDRTLWIGLNDVVTENTFSWISGDGATYRKWGTGEPNNGGGYYPNEDHVSMRSPAVSQSGYWNDAPGDFIYAPVVEFP